MRIILLIAMLLSGCERLGYTATLDQWADAIGHAENSRSHPYGIMVRYRHTTPRQACMNTVRHQYRLWVYMRSTGYPGAFLPYLASVYAPIGSGNDPTGLNRNWTRNVLWYLRRRIYGNNIKT